MQKRPEDASPLPKSALLAGFLVYNATCNSAPPVVPASPQKRRRPVRAVGWLAFAIALALVPVSLWLLRSHFPAVTQSFHRAAISPPPWTKEMTGRADDGKKGDPAVSATASERGNQRRRAQARSQSGAPDTRATTRHCDPEATQCQIQNSTNRAGRSSTSISCREPPSMPSCSSTTPHGHQRHGASRDANHRRRIEARRRFQKRCSSCDCQNQGLDVGPEGTVNYPRLEHLGIENTRVTDEVSTCSPETKPGTTTSAVLHQRTAA